MYNTIFDELFDLNREMSRLFSSAEGAGIRKWPETNIYENSDEYIVVSKIPGMLKEDIDISLKDNSLTIKGTRKKEVPKGARLHLEERSTDVFERNFLLNEKLDVEKISAEALDGLLMIKMPKSPRTKPKKIEIK